MESLTDKVKEIEKEEIINALRECNWVMSRAARKLSITERMKFSAWITFSILWMTFVYVPVAHWVWGGGFLANLGALDFAGGTVVHINAGIAALMGALVLGKRREAALKPSNLTFVVTGAGLFCGLGGSGSMQVLHWQRTVLQEQPLSIPIPQLLWLQYRGCLLNGYIQRNQLFLDLLQVLLQAWLR